MFKIMKGVEQRDAVEIFSKMENISTRVQSRRVNKMRVGTALSQGSFSQRIDNAWNCLPGKVVVVEGMYRFKLEMDRYRDALEL